MSTGSSDNDVPLICRRTNWKIAAGDIGKSVTVESSFSPGPDSDSDSQLGDTDDSLKSTALVLKPPSPDSGPCEIRISFLQNHEIRQIYVRSTARVYEIYYAQSQQSTNEYLCTVRCSIAERDEQVVQSIDIEDLSEAYIGNSLVDLNQEKITGERNNSNSEDDWVEVKVTDSPLLEHRISSLSNRNSTNRGRDIQDFYEATAEISDAYPCTSVAIRFLSLQNKGFVCIDEVYVFADLVDSSNQETQVHHVEGSAGNSLMAILVPTLLQLSKSGSSQVQSQRTYLENANRVDNRSKSTDSTDVASEIHQDGKWSADQQCVKLQDINGSTSEPAEICIPSQIVNVDISDDPLVRNDSRCDHVASEIHQDGKRSADQQCVNLQDINGSTSEPAEVHIPNQILNRDISVDPLLRNESRCDHVEKLLGQLVSRVSKIEEVCLRFEENMLKPIKSMEMRIQQVEQQLELLVKDSRHSELPPGTKICAPSFSCESNSSSFHSDGHDYQPYETPNLEKKESNSIDLFSACDGMQNSVNAPHFLPSLVVAAPEFSCGEDEQDDDDLESEKNSEEKSDLKSNKNSEEKSKRPLIDDFLSAALSGFLSSSTVHPSECVETPFVAYDTSDRDSNKWPSDNVQTLPSKSLEVIDTTNSYGEAIRYTQILTVKAPEFTSEENCGEEHLDYAQSPSISSHKFTIKETDGNNEVSLSSIEHRSSQVTSVVSDLSTDNMKANQFPISSTVPSAVSAEPNSKIPDDKHPGLADLQDKFCDGTAACYFSVMNNDYAADQADSRITHVCQVTEESDQREPAIILSPERKNAREQFFAHQSNQGSSIVGTADGGTDCVAAEGSEEDSLQNFFQSSVSSSVDFEIPILDVKFTTHEDLISHSPLEVLLGETSNFTDIYGPLTSKDLLVDPGTYDVLVTSNVGNVLNDPLTSTSCNDDTVASLI